MMKKYVLPLLILLLVLAACNTPGAEVTPTPTEQVTPTPEVSDTETDQGVYIAALLREAAQIQKIDAEFEYGTGQFIAQSRSTIESVAVEFYYALRAQLESLEDIDFSVFWDPEADRAPLEAFLDELKSFRSEEYPITWANVEVRKIAGYELKGLEGEKVDVQYSGGFSFFCPTEPAQFQFAGLPIDHRLTFVCRDRRWYISDIEDTEWQWWQTEDDTRYFFAQSYFLGAWSDGQWRSCEDGGFTVGEILNRDYYDLWGEPLGTIRISVAGPGGFDEVEGAVELLEPYGILEGDDLVMKLPVRLIGQAAQVAAPNYNFWAYFEGQPHYFVSNVSIELPSYRKAWGSDSLLPFEVVSAALEEAGIHSDPFNMSREVWACDMDGDGQEEYLELLQTLFDESGYATLEPGDQCCYALLLRDGEEVRVVASRAIDYTTDVTAHFSAGDVQFCDLDGDGICEIIFCEQCWEWGCYEAYSLIDGAWTLVLRSNYGM